MSDLDARLIAAHNAKDGPLLAALYTEAARGVTDADMQCFFLTHAYVYALEAGLSDAATIKAQLIAAGRETPTSD